MERASTGRVAHYKMADLCDRCQALDVLSIIRSLRVNDWTGERITRLGSSSQWPLGTCQLCKLFSDLYEASWLYRQRPEERMLQTVELRAYSSRLLRESQSQFLNIEYLEDTTILGITTDVGEDRSVAERHEMGCIHLIPGASEAWPRAVQARLMRQDAVSLDVVLEWLHACEKQHHRSCGKPPERPIGRLWLIDCQTCKVVPAGSNPKYVALSYVCGVFEVQQTDGVYDFDASPRTIRDAVSVTKSLGLRYLWIDKYCIKSKDTSHMMQQVYQMHKIYEHAHLTIIAANGRDAHAGLPGINGQSRARQPQARIGSDLLVSSLPWISYDLQYTTWSSRGWTFQEGTLSRRRLIFTDKQVYFECQDQNACEAIHDPTAFDVHTINNTQSTSYESAGPTFSRHFEVGAVGGHASSLGLSENISRHVNMYVHRNLSYDTDILHAIMGVLTKYQDSGNVKFFWGMPCFLLDRGVNSKREFMRQMAHLRPKGTDGRRRRREFPSWSWLGWNRASLVITNRLSFDHCFECSIDVELSTGQLISWETWLYSTEKPSQYLHITGPFVSLSLELDERGMLCGCFELAEDKSSTHGPYQIRIDSWHLQSTRGVNIWAGKLLLALVYTGSQGIFREVNCILFEPQGDYFEICGTGHGNSTYAGAPNDPGQLNLALITQRSLRIG